MSEINKDPGIAVNKAMGALKDAIRFYSDRLEFADEQLSEARVIITRLQNATRAAQEETAAVRKKKISDFIFWVLLSVVLGAMLGASLMVFLPH